MKATLLIGALEKVTSTWTKQRKAEERSASRAARRRDALVRSRRITVKDAAREEIPAAYLMASTDGTLPAHARQIMYAARRAIQEATGDMLNDKYFTQKLLPDFMLERPTTTANWDVVFDARGHFQEPHTEIEVPLGTLSVREYLNGVRAHVVNDIDVGMKGDILFPTRGPDNRFSAVLFIEKEGFLPLFKAVKLAERFDLAIMSTKGMSVTASRQLIDAICGERKILLLVLHDFDKSGFSILGTLARSGRRYAFANKVEVIDLGLRLEDIRKHGLLDEAVAYGRKNPARNLRQNGATAEEIEFLCGQYDGWCYSGRRVELNAFFSGNFVAFVEEKLQRHGIRKVVPDADTLSIAYRRALKAQIVSKHIEDMLDAAEEEAASIAIPAQLEQELRRGLEADPARSWDEVLASVVRARRHK